MIIRSQGKKTIINFGNVLEVICNKANEIIVRRSVDDCQEVIGEYSTEEKAVKVLDMICEFANGIHFEKVATERCGTLDGVVFDMPEDCEV